MRHFEVPIKLTFHDQYSWIPGQYPGEGEACLWDKSYNKKPAYTSIVNLFQSAASAGLRSSATPAAASIEARTVTVATTFATATVAAQR